LTRQGKFHLRVFSMKIKGNFDYPLKQSKR
jgi:hypothetical protein